ncbi:MopE-related protein [Archangium lansingense]|uniref:MopE-related protein n=1 Tax=Archangium lansingense TaxID=2995310 RepID=UPI003B7CEC30
MPPRLLNLVGLLALIGLGCRNNDGAVKLTVSYSGFKPGCIRVGVQDAQGAGEPRTTELAGKGEVTGGTVTVAAFRESGWGTTLTATAEAFETQCSGTPVVTTSETVTVAQGEVAEKELKLAATDADGDGYVSQSTGGTDCDDSSSGLHPGAQELCNDRDDNCDGKKDESFEVGQLCDATDGCKGAWSCDSQSTRTCVAKPGQWRPDADKDGQGSSQGPGVTSCSPPAGHVANALDCDDSNAQRYTGAPELCNTVDDNCDGTPDDGLELGFSCTGAGNCTGTRVCGTDGGVMCNSPTPTVLYADNDQDSYGAADAGVTNCGPTRSGYVSNSTDCDDTRAKVYPGAPELCDTLDNDCDTSPDEGLDLGASCDPGLGCTGAKACETDGGILCAFVTPPSTYYPDDDLDLHGKADAGVQTCAPSAGYILAGGDCNDGNPFTHVDARELCDEEDNNCNGSPDEGNACPAGGGSWVDKSSGGSDTWQSVSVWGGGGVWVAGGTNLLGEIPPGQTSFVSLNGQCTGVWNAVWADPRNGQATLGGNSAALGYHATGTTVCTNSTDATDTDVQGVAGVRLPDSSYEYHLVGLNNVYPYGGRVLRSTGGPFQNGTVADPLLDVHGISREVLFAVGGYISITGINARLYRYKPDQGVWEDENVHNIPGVVDGRLRGVWVVNPRLAYAVGENGAMLIWNGTSWSPMAGPNTQDLLSVLAFGRNAVYVAAANGKVYRYDGSSWSQVSGVSSGNAFNDLAGSSPEDIWVVGEKGKRFHWPR